MWHQPQQRCKYTTSVDIQKRAIKRLIRDGKKGGRWYGGGGEGDFIPFVTLSSPERLLH